MKYRLHTGMLHPDRYAQQFDTDDRALLIRAESLSRALSMLGELEEGQAPEQGYAQDVLRSELQRLTAQMTLTSTKPYVCSQ